MFYFNTLSYWRHHYITSSPTDYQLGTFAFHSPTWSVTKSGKFYCGFIPSFKNYILYLSPLIIFYNTFTIVKMFPKRDSTNM